MDHVALSCCLHGAQMLPHFSIVCKQYTRQQMKLWV